MSEEATVAPAGVPRRTLLRRLLAAPEMGISLILLGMVVFLSLYTRTFLTSTNIFNILRAFSWIAIAAYGECLVIIMGGVDLSVGSVMGLSGLASALTTSTIPGSSPIPHA